MVKLVMCLCRNPKMSREQFQDYWLNSHGPFFQKFADTHKAKKYVQNHTIDTPLNNELRESRGMAQEYDGVAEIWFESEKEFVDAMSSPEGQKLGAALFEDEANFLDHAKSTAFFAEEHEL